MSTSPILRLSTTATPRALRVSTSRLSVVISNSVPQPSTTTTTPQRRSFSASAAQQQGGLKEDAPQGDEQAQVRRQREGKGKGKGEWQEGLASNSEVNVRADREAGAVRDHGEHMRELQGVGKEKGEKENREV
ncbi:uncharacterized protein BKCO1_6100060 [Diplodia corticola]|uniref:Uncharacterized protein n=1 Tax=Diplodia corticola TaxID=236234 RepID=A0A1J9QPI7_9PEZI|nr:uncharacterized protein BKCO1_6100060 [Diplodia corticola]OJD30368.1 hypothetical protein BKCO1_6100060 [Diplodia corticola]